MRACADLAQSARAGRDEPALDTALAAADEFAVRVDQLGRVPSPTIPSRQPPRPSGPAGTPSEPGSPGPLTRPPGTCPAAATDSVHLLASRSTAPTCGSPTTPAIRSPRSRPDIPHPPTLAGPAPPTQPT